MPDDRIVYREHKNKTPGLYDEAGNLIKSWQQMVDSRDLASRGGELVIQPETRFEGYLYLDESVTNIPDVIFEGHDELKGIHMGNNVKSIGAGAFEGCKNLEWVEVSGGLSSVGSHAFAECSNLKEIWLNGNMRTIPEGMCQNCVNLRSAYIPITASTIEQDAFRGCSSLEELSGSNRIPDSIKHIRDHAFTDCPALQSVWVRTGTHISKDAFDDSTEILYRGEKSGGGDGDPAQEREYPKPPEKKKPKKIPVNLRSRTPSAQREAEAKARKEAGRKMAQERDWTGFNSRDKRPPGGISYPNYKSDVQIKKTLPDIKHVKESEKFVPTTRKYLPNISVTD